MPDIKEGLQTGPQAREQMFASDSAVDAQLAIREQTRASHSVDDAAAFAPADLLDVQETSIKSGLKTANDTNKHGMTQAEVDAVLAEQHRFENTPEGQRQIAAEDAAGLARDEELSDASMLRAAAALEQFSDAIAEGDYSQAAFTLFAGDSVAQAHILSEWYGEDIEDPNARQEIAELHRLYQQDQVSAAEADMQATVAKLSIMAAAQRVAIAHELAEQRGLDPKSPFAREWIADLERAVADAGADVASLDGATYKAALRGADEMTRASVQAVEDARFKQALLDTDDTSVRGGLTINAGMGEVPLVPRPTIQPRPVDSARLARAMSGTLHETGEQIRAGIVSDPLRDGPEGYAAVQAVGAAERERYEKARAEAQHIIGGL